MIVPCKLGATRLVTKRLPLFCCKSTRRHQEPVEESSSNAVENKND